MLAYENSELDRMIETYGVSEILNRIIRHFSGRPKKNAFAATVVSRLQTDYSVLKPLEDYTGEPVQQMPKETLVTLSYSEILDIAAKMKELPGCCCTADHIGYLMMEGIKKSTGVDFFVEEAKHGDNAGDEEEAEAQGEPE